MSTPVPEEAVRLALVARADALLDRPDPMVLGDEQLTRQMLQAAAPALAAAERERLADRAKMLAEVRNELDDAFQFAEASGQRHGYVTREWVQALLATHAASAAAAEMERFALLLHCAESWDDIRAVERTLAGEESPS